MDGELLVRFRSDVLPAQREALHGELDGREVRDLQRGVFHVSFEGRTLGEALEAYQSDSRVEYAEPNWLRYPAYTPNDPRYATNQYGPQQVDAPLAWDLQNGDASIVIAIVDSGVDVDHPDLDDHLAYGFDFFSNDSDPDDQDGHGTHVAGIAAAETDNGVGIAGMGFNCRFAAYRCGDGFYPLSDTIASINDAVAMGAHVINMSYGSGTFSVSERDAIKAAQIAGCVPVAAAGNDGTDVEHYPAAYARVLAVANTDQNDNKYFNSNFGDWVDVAAPGTAIHSTYLNGNYANLWGTSMASPLVAGLAGLLYAELGGTRNQVNADLIRDAIENSSVPKTFVEFGRVDALAALFEISPPDGPIVSAILPAQVNAFFDPQITITGTNFLGVNQLDIGGTLYDPSQFTIVSNSILTVDLPNASALGTVPVTVTTAGGTAAGSFEFVETSPPQITAPDIGVPGASYTVEWAGGQDDLYVLVYATSPQTVPFLGYDLLLGLTVAEIGIQDNVGYGSLTLPSLGSSGFLTLHLQVINVDDLTSSLSGISNVESAVFL